MQHAVFLHVMIKLSLLAIGSIIISAGVILHFLEACSSTSSAKKYLDTLPHLARDMQMRKYHFHVS